MSITTQQNDDNAQISLDRLARDTLRLSRNALLVKLRFLDVALSSLEPVRLDGATIATDGRHIIYDPKHVLRRYKLAKEAPVRDYLHMVLHCVFRHMFVGPTMERDLWNLACDIAVENMINELNLDTVAMPAASLQEEYVSRLKGSVKHMTAEKIYAYLRQTAPSQAKIEKMQQLFGSDNHAVWYTRTDSDDEDEGGEGNQDGNGGSGKVKGDGSGDGNGSGKAKGNQDSEGDQDGDGGGNNKANPNDIGVQLESKAVWQQISERMQVDMETFSKRQGTEAGAMMQNLAAVNREKYDYTAFLKKFAVMGEAMRINDDEFDYIFYTYGLKLYDKMPLIEPLEYKDIKAIREFVIAIDTSGSTSGELVQKFIQKTYNVLQSTESFFSKINLHIIQCDAEIQEDKKITCKKEFDEYLKTMRIRGLGGTDFRPVFEYVEKLRNAKEFVNLKGLIYFTDGWGDFPQKMPEYDTAFVFIDDDYNNPDVPPWAIKLVLQKDEI